MFILEDTNRVSKFKEKLIAGEVREDRILPVKRMIVQLEIGIIIAKYSRGDSLDNIKSNFEEIIDLFVEAWDLSSYENNLRFLSISESILKFV